MDGLERRFHSPRDYLDLARSENVTARQLAELAQQPYAFVRIAVAEHPATPAHVLEQLFPSDLNDWNDQAVLVALATNPSSPSSLISSIAAAVPSALHLRDAQQVFEAGIELFRREDVDLHVLVALLEDPHTTTEFRKVAARETTRSDVLEVLRLDRSEKVRRALEKRSQNDGELR